MKFYHFTTIHITKCLVRALVLCLKYCASLYNILYKLDEHKKMKAFSVCLSSATALSTTTPSRHIKNIQCFLHRTKNRENSKSAFISIHSFIFSITYFSQLKANSIKIEGSKSTGSKSAKKLLPTSNAEVV